MDANQIKNVNWKMSVRIVLDNSGTYQPGDTVHGKVVCNQSSSQSFRALRCRLRGREHTAWTERESYYDSQSKSTKWRTVHYSGDNKFLAINQDLLGEGTLSPGYHSFPFAFTLPKVNMPNPYNGNYGYIRYYIKAVMDIPFAFDQEDEVTLHIISPINFNFIRQELCLDPVSYQDDKTICCCCCASDPITMEVNLEKEAFVVGEVAKIKVDITNMSNESIVELNVSMKMTIESKTTSPRTHHKYDTELIGLISDTGVGAHGQRVYNIDFQIPQSAIIPNFYGSSLFKQWCVLKVEAVIPGCHSNLEIESGVHLGHIPILEYNSEPQPPRVNWIPASEAPGGLFPTPPIFNPGLNPPPYSPEKAPPYPTGSPGFPTPFGYGEGSSSSATAPREEEAPSAPSKAQLAQGEKEEPPPPSYNEIVKGQFTNPTAPTAPPS
ncbi:arrestin domain-containing protein 2-like isoform X2 [Diorhabda carinulata]|uniref:arrestin domain-containing protein 2-like isoform X2 n=1 Tax=Diorhabda carinulata TaxID=1163345 RepID=UPI0025A1E2B0|nr:arrestin domain-containing protein 2-like isoform X2 [Diorhabda carinulata]